MTTSKTFWETIFNLNLSTRYSFEDALQILTSVFKAHFMSLFLGDQVNVPVSSDTFLVMPEQFAGNSLYPAPLNSITYLFGYSYPQSVSLVLVLFKQYQKVPACNLF
jgi:hypothetical protein